MTARMVTKKMKKVGKRKPRKVSHADRFPLIEKALRKRTKADIICLADHATGGMVSPIMYRDMLLPLHQEIVAAVGCPTVLHCCGKYFRSRGAIRVDQYN